MKKLVNLFIIVILVFMGAEVKSQEKETVKRLKELGREKIIEMAEAKIKKDHPEFNSENYDQIKVMFGKKTLYVTFDQSFKFVPYNSSYYYGVYVNLVENMTSKAVLSNLEVDTLMPKVNFFVPNEESKKAIAFVIDAVNKSNEVGSIENNKLPDGNDMTIFDKGNYFRITVDSESTTSSYKISKTTGEIYDAGHKHKARNPEYEENFEELK